jgi:hypothetical protein
LYRAQNIPVPHVHWNLGVLKQQERMHVSERSILADLSVFTILLLFSDALEAAIP